MLLTRLYKEQAWNQDAHRKRWEEIPLRNQEMQMQGKENILVHIMHDLHGEADAISSV